MTRTRIRTLVPCCLVLFALVSVCRRAQAQDDGVPTDGVYGYTSIEYESDGSIDAYSETDMDPDLEPYYQTCVSLNVTDSNGGSDGSNPGVCTDSTTIEVEVIVPSSQVQSNLTYTATGAHYGILTQYEDDGWCIDYYDMSYFENSGIDAPFDYPFISVGTGDTVPYNFILLGETYDSASVTTPTACGDDRDQIIAQYAQYTVALHPTCSDFTNDQPPNYTGHDDNYAFSSLSTSHDYPDWAILEDVLLGGLDTTVDDYGSAPTITSGYRDPYTNSLPTVGGLHNSPHMYGVAADLASNSGTWQKLHDAGKSAGACVEPLKAQRNLTSHVHVDWRSGGCPKDW